MSEGMNIVLMLDANENVNDGIFNNIMVNLNMQNAHSKYLRSPLPPTHHKGSVPISAMYISPNIIIKGAGILSKGIGIQGDHRNMFLDVSITSLLGTPMYKVEPPKVKLLKLNDPRIYKKFIKKVKSHYLKCGLQQKSEQITKSILAGTMSQKEIKLAQEKIDEQMGRGIKSGIRKCRKLYTGDIPFSSVFLELLQVKRLWLLVLKKKLGQKISSKTIRRLSKIANVQNPLQYPIPVIKAYLSEAEAQYKAFIPHAPTERQHFYEELAAANAVDGTATKATILKRIMNSEASRENGKRMSQFFPKRGISKRVDRVAYTVNNTNMEATEPDDIVQQIQTETKIKYTSSHNTPLMEPSAHELFGNFAETKWAKQFQNGTKPLPTSLSPWVVKILRKLQISDNVPIQNSMMTESEIKSVWKSIKEKKASSWSGRYNAVYKAFCYDPYLLKQLTLSMNLPFISGVAYSRWYEFLDIMSFKKQNSIHVNSLRTIIISEADWNAAGKVFITRRMMRNAEKMKLLPEEHLGGRKGKKSTDGGLTKRMIMDNARLLEKPMAIVSTDAANCYDRMIHKIISMSAIKWGVPGKVIKALLSPLHRAIHHTRTAYGDSEISFTGNNLQGAGQGNTGAAPFWTMVSTHMIELMKEMEHQATFLSPITKQKIILSLIAFVDDTELFLTQHTNDIHLLVKKANEAINTWKELLKVTGGAMRPEKCAWTLMRFDKKNNQTQLAITIPNSDNIETPIQQYSSKQPRQYLGILQRTDGKENDQIQALLTSIEQWNNQMQSSRLFPSQNLSATLMKISRTILYPLPALTINEKQCTMISNKLYSACLPKCGVSSKFPRDFRYLPQQYQGLGLPNMFYEQEAAKLKELVYKSYSEGICWKQMELGLEIAQSLLGARDIIFNLNYPHYEHMLPQTWLKSMWKFLHDQKLQVRGWQAKLLPQREYDPTIMEVFIQKGVGKSTLTVLNKCRKYLDVIFLSDICTGDGKRISALSLNAQHRCKHINTYSTTTQVKPSVGDKYMWKQYIHSCFCVGSNSSRLTQPLGKWTAATFTRFTWYYNKSSDTLLKRLTDTTFKIYSLETTHRTSNRYNKKWYKFLTIAKLKLMNDGNIWAATVEKDQHSKAQLDGTHPFETPDPIPNISTLQHQLQADRVPTWIYKYVPDKYLDKSKVIIKNMLSQKMRIVSDGSYKGGDMGAATIIETWDMSQRIILPTPVPTNNSSHSKADSYRAEAVGITAALHLMHAMEKLSGMKTELDLACDNERVLDALQFFTYLTPKMKHYDVVKSMLNIRDSLSSIIQYRHVKAHKSERISYDKLTRLEQLNTECDLLAKIARKELPKVIAQENIFQHEGLTIWDDQQEKLSSNLDQSLYHHFFQKKALSVLQHKYGWNEGHFHMINWNAIRSSNQLLTQATRQWMSKFVTKFLPIGRNMLRRQHWRQDYCPRCRVCVETHDHLLTCTHPQCLHTFRTSLEKLELWLVNQHTPQELLTDILHTITEWKMGIATPPSPHHTHPIYEQLKLGARHLIEGRLHIAFETYMDQHYLSIGSKKSGKIWSATFIQKIWILIHRPQWENRNSFVHKLNEESRKTRERENLQHEMTTLYLSTMKENLLASDQHLYAASLNDLLQGPNAHIQAWIEEMRVSLASRDRQFFPFQQKQAAFMHSWMRTKKTTNPPIRTFQKKPRVSIRPRRRITLLADRNRKRKSNHPPQHTPKRRRC